MTSPISGLFASFGAGTPAHQRREEMIAAQQAAAQEAQLVQAIPQMLPKQQEPAAAPVTPAGPARTPTGPSQSFLSAAAAAPQQQNVGAKTLLGA